ncbi:hypothetical protein HMPREF1531_00304 [Propionibacterium sp. oral taxon 192 str. F0372]|uniref:class I SAM-dependent methyltransferase n=1 Tax=Propionibacterium sp. oral taxon 192 TaxID=671222 RepID=UPI00035295AA|nr:class I SAM-dependent methyltransferase [Propionibacterium sp. oral taxon 192]EPH07247.1 hypothetical protein HMPREF1531_00304 [Propionibacterium sp. oral taxon 192 str. F0372]
MTDLNPVESTLFVPLQGRVYATRRFPHILEDEKAVRIADELDPFLMDMSRQSQYTLMASAIRSVNIDRCVRRFLAEHPAGSIVNLGCGLDTTSNRTDNGMATFFEIDLPEIIEMRGKYLPAGEREVYLARSMFDPAWIDEVRNHASDPFLVVASGLFHYFHEPKVVELMNRLGELGGCELIFDAVSSAGLRRMHAYMKRLGHEDASMFFHVDDAYELVTRLDVSASVIEERDFFDVPGSRKGLRAATRLSMWVSDRFHMVKMIHLAIPAW